MHWCAEKTHGIDQGMQVQPSTRDTRVASLMNYVQEMLPGSESVKHPTSFSSVLHIGAQSYYARHSTILQLGACATNRHVGSSSAPAARGQSDTLDRWPYYVQEPKRYKEVMGQFLLFQGRRLRGTLGVSSCFFRRGNDMAIIVLEARLPKALPDLNRPRRLYGAD